MESQRLRFAAAISSTISDADGQHDPRGQQFPQSHSFIRDISHLCDVFRTFNVKNISSPQRLVKEKVNYFSLSPGFQTQNFKQMFVFLLQIEKYLV